MICSPGKIQHVIYIVKENRTYDQILGDLPQGNGDMTRCLFPREVTPNFHALAERFVLLDNFYDSGEVSGDGWTWSTQAQANEYTIRNVPYNYSTRGRTFDFEGANNAPTPTCMIADNDYAIGELVDAVSHSPIWNSTAILILEDDAQNGPDHVDAHRSICFCISPWIKKSSVDHSFQNTVSTIKTIESLLNLPPMSQYDAAAPVINDFDTAPNNAEPYTAIFPNESLIAQRNPSTGKNDTDFNPEQPNNAPAPVNQGAANIPLNSTENIVAASNAMDFSHADQAPADILNQIIWKSVRGPHSEMPPTPHVIGTTPAKDNDE